MFSLKSLSISPSRTSLSIPATSPLSLGPPSPSHSSAAGKSPSASSSTSDRTSYFPGPTSAPTTPTTTTTTTTTAPQRARPRYVSRDEALKTVKAMEDVLVAWNEYRIVLASLGKSGRKLGNALKGLAGCMDKTEIAAQTIRPTATMLEGLAALTVKLSKKVDKEYEETNSDASKYFSLLAKESRTHDAYLGAIGKKHDKAEKAYRKASKSLSDTAGAHSGLLALKDTLSEDISRAQEDHHGLIGAKQASVLLRMASSTGALASNLLAFYSDGLRQTSSSYPDIEYFRCLADARWTSTLPQSLEDELEEDKKRDEIRLIKARVALGESDIVGQSAWAIVKGTNYGTTEAGNRNLAATVDGAGMGITAGRLEGSGRPTGPSQPATTRDAAEGVSKAGDVSGRTAFASTTDQPGSIGSAGDAAGGIDQNGSSASAQSTEFHSANAVQVADRTPNTTSPPIPHHSRPSTSTSTSKSTLRDSLSFATDTHHSQSSVSSSDDPRNSVSAPPSSSNVPSQHPAARRHFSTGLPPSAPANRISQERPEQLDARHNPARRSSEAFTWSTGDSRGMIVDVGQHPQPPPRSKAVTSAAVQRAIPRYEDLAVGLGEKGHESVPMTRSPNLPQPARPPYTSNQQTRSIPHIPSTSTTRHDEMSTATYEADRDYHSGHRRSTEFESGGDSSHQKTGGGTGSGTARSAVFQHHRGHESFVRGCELCEMDHERMLRGHDRLPLLPPQHPHSLPDRQRDHLPLQQQHQQRQPYPNTRRVTMPPFLPPASNARTHAHAQAPGHGHGPVIHGREAESGDNLNSLGPGQNQRYARPDHNPRRTSYNARYNHHEDEQARYRCDPVDQSADPRSVQEEFAIDERLGRGLGPKSIFPSSRRSEDDHVHRDIGSAPTDFRGHKSGGEFAGGRRRAEEVHAPRPRRAVGVGMSMSPDLDLALDLDLEHVREPERDRNPDRNSYDRW